MALGGTAQEIKNTRIQDAFEKGGAKNENAPIATFVLQLMKSSAINGLEQFSPSELQTIAQLSSIDPLVKKCLLVEAGKKSALEGEEEHKSLAKEAKQRKFIKEQSLALSVGAALALKKVKQDLLLALKDFSTQEKKQIGDTIGSFTKQSMGQGVKLLLERGFILLLRMRGRNTAARSRFACSVSAAPRSWPYRTSTKAA